MKNKRNILLLIAVVIFTPLYFFIEHETTERQKLGTVTAFSRNVGGLGLFYTLAKDFVPATLRTKPLLKWEEISSYKTIIMASPLFMPTSRQNAILSEFVDYGGTLVLSFHNEMTLEIVKTILGEVTGKNDFAAKIDERFENGKASIVSGARLAGDEKLKIFSPGQTYTFYTQYKIDDTDCRQNNLNCFVKIIRSGGGEVVVIAGLPPMGNALIGKTDNRHMASRMLGALSPMLIDEYYHGYSDRTIWDLFDLPLFALPITGMILLMLLYFIFALDPMATIVVGENKKSLVSTSHHRSSELIFADFLSRQGLYEHALTEQARFLKQLFSQDKILIDKKLNLIRTHHTNLKQKKNFLLAARELTLFHNELAAVHGGKKS